MKKDSIYTIGQCLKKESSAQYLQEDVLQKRRAVRLNSSSYLHINFYSIKELSE